jgi:hypothetical protein
MNSRPIYDRLRSFCFAFLRPTAKLAGWLGWLAGGASPVPCCFTAIIVSKKTKGSEAPTARARLPNGECHSLIRSRQ